MNRIGPGPVGPQLSCVCCRLQLKSIQNGITWGSSKGSCALMKVLRAQKCHNEAETLFTVLTETVTSSGTSPPGLFTATGRMRDWVRGCSHNPEKVLGQRAVCNHPCIEAAIRRQINTKGENNLPLWSQSFVDGCLHNGWWGLVISRQPGSSQTQFSSLSNGPRQSQRHVARVVSRQRQCFQSFIWWNNNFKELWPAEEWGGGGRKERLTRKGWNGNSKWQKAGEEGASEQAVNNLLNSTPKQNLWCKKQVISDTSLMITGWTTAPCGSGRQAGSHQRFWSSEMTPVLPALVFL